MDKIYVKKDIKRESKIMGFSNKIFKAKISSS